ncbi:hypothetical protein M378DRAFT_643970 [Amanita muscaria Koide BX008]|uniref:Uncharacterized protein n=1 Tax=Amanita muscaria (strain Koide BX008) TaxID=946122 RepID=A0A0C2X5Q7_AMAMK|nr:hypothetical protein M378DRAFT_643970 [Amanita muscaria Koide BX008]
MANVSLVRTLYCCQVVKCIEWLRSIAWLFGCRSRRYKEKRPTLIYLEIAQARSSMEIMMTPRSDVGKTSIAKVPNMFFGDVRCTRKNVSTCICREEPET